MISEYLRPYQKEQVGSVVTHAKAGKNRLMVGSAVGTGKSVTMGELGRLAKKPLWVMPNLNLLHQMHGNLCRYLNEEIDVEQGGRHVSNSMMHRTRGVIASVDSLLSNERYRKFADRTLVLVDECHLGNTEKRAKMYQWLEQQGATVVGLTATPFTAKGKKLDYWNDPVWYRSLLDFIRDGWLVRPLVSLLDAVKFDWTLFDEIAFNEYNVDELMSEESTAHEIVNAVMQLSKGEASAVYCPGRKTMWRTREVFERFGVKVSCVWGTQDPADRLVNMEAFRTGETKVILNVGVLAYGWDSPSLRNIFSAAPTRSLCGVEQRLGRGTRSYGVKFENGMTAEERLDLIEKSEKPHFHYYDLTHSMSSIRLASAFDIFDRASREDDERRTRMAKACTGEEVDIIEAVQETAEDIAREERKKEERRKAMLGIEFERRGIDAFGEKQESRRGFRLFYGPFRGQLMREVPSGVLKSHLRRAKAGTDYAKALAGELLRRA